MNRKYSPARKASEDQVTSEGIPLDLKHDQLAASGLRWSMKRKLCVGFASVCAILMCIIVVVRENVKNISDNTSAASAHKSSVSLEKVAQRSDTFGVQLFNSLRRNGGMDKNVFVSPYSVYVALGMLTAGSNKETRNQLVTAMQMSEFQEGTDDTGIHQAMMESLDLATSAGFNTANGVWVDNKGNLQQNFSLVLDQFYHAVGRSVDFSGSPDSARIEINEWVATETRDRIKDLLPPPSVTSDTYSVLCNTIYFKEKWAQKFTVKDTPAAFHLPTGAEKTVTYITTKQDLRHYYDAKIDADIVFVPYQKEAAAAVVVVPRQQNGLNAMQLTEGTISTAFTEAGAPQEVRLTLPKFKVDTKESLNAVLEQLGLSRMFTERAEFARMASKPLQVSDVYHAAFVSVDEEGTEAAAATGVVMMSRSLPFYPQVTADRPFLFGLVNILPEGKSTSTMFLGAINDPSV